MSVFQVYHNNQWITPPDSAKPVAIGSPELPYPPVVRRNPPTARSGLGFPVQANAELWAEVGRPRISAAGIQWWTSVFNWGGQPYVERYVKLYDPLAQQWKSYRAYVHQPEYDGARAGYILVNFRVRMSNLVEANP